MYTMYFAYNKCSVFMFGCWWLLFGNRECVFNSVNICELDRMTDWWVNWATLNHGRIQNVIRLCCKCTWFQYTIIGIVVINQELLHLISAHHELRAIFGTVARGVWWINVTILQSVNGYSRGYHKINEPRKMHIRATSNVTNI